MLKDAAAKARKAREWADHQHFYALLALMAAALFMAVYVISRAGQVSRGLSGAGEEPETQTQPAKQPEMQWQF